MNAKITPAVPGREAHTQTLLAEELAALVEACPEFKVVAFPNYLGTYLWCVRPDGGRLDDDEVDAIYRMAEAAKRLLPGLLRLRQPDASQSPGEMRCYSCHGVGCPDCGGTGFTTHCYSARAAS